MRTNTTTTLYECDRCGRRVANPWVADDAADNRWETISIQASGAVNETTFPIGVGSKDICPNCSQSFIAWWEKGRC